MVLTMIRRYYFITAILAAIAIVTQVTCFSTAGWDLSAKLRSMIFAATIRHDIEWFDEDKHSVSPSPILEEATNTPRPELQHLT